MALILPVGAIEKPAAQDAPKEKVNKAEADAMRKKAAPLKLAMLGLGGAPVSETLSLHLGLEDGKGLTVLHVVPGSAAEKAGLKAHDILTEFAGKKIASQHDLRKAVLEHKPGDKVVIKFIKKGKAMEKEVVLGEREDRPHIPRAPRGGLDAPGLDPMRMFEGFGGQIPEGDRKRMEEQMKKHLDQLQKQLGQDGLKLDLKRLLDMQGGKKPGQGNALPGGIGIGSSIIIKDDKGTVTMKMNNGKKEVIVTDNDGKVLYEGPYDTEQDKAAVPDDIRERLDRLNLDMNGGKGLRLQLGPGGMVPPPAPGQEDNAQ